MYFKPMLISVAVDNISTTSTSTSPSELPIPQLKQDLPTKKVILGITGSIATLTGVAVMVALCVHLMNMKKNTATRKVTQDNGVDQTELSECLLSQERDIFGSNHFSVLNKYEPILCKAIELEGTDVLRNLVQKGVISNDVEQKVKGLGQNQEKVKAILKILKHSSNDKLQKFCEVLYENNCSNLVVIEKCLLTKENLTSARKKLMHYILEEFHDVDMYSVDGEPHPLPLNKIYVQMEWTRCTGINRGKTQRLDSYLDIFSKMRKHNETRAVISAVPGGGKTSFVKHIASIWAKEHQSDILGSEEEDQVSINNEIIQRNPLFEFKVLIPIILRLISKPSSLKDIFLHQIGGLSFLDAAALFRFIEQNENSILIILDGYDELKIYDTVNKLICKKILRNVTVMCTTRPHGLTILRSLGSEATEQELQLCGFNDVQKMDYIRRFFEIAEEPKEVGEALFQTLRSERKELLPLARVPIQLQIMCIVWNQYRDLGYHIVDLYAKFADCLIHHAKIKSTMKERYRVDVCQCTEYEGVLMDTADVSYSWTKEGTLENVFFYEVLTEKYGKKVENIVSCGFLVKYHPTAFLQKSYWSFTHQTVQEYFVALYLAKKMDQKVASHFLGKCCSTRRLEHLNMVFKFLCGLDTMHANEILTNIIKRTRGKEDCKALLRFLLDLMPYYKEEKDINLPLPQEVAWKRSTSHFFLLMESDTKQKNRNLKELSIEPEAELPSSGLPSFDLKYLQKAKVTVGKNYKSSAPHFILPLMGGIRNIQFFSKNFASEDIAYLLKDIPKDNIESLEFYHFKEYINASEFQIDLFSKLTSLTLNTPVIDLKEFNRKIWLCQNIQSLAVVIKEMNFDVFGFPPIVLKLTVEVLDSKGIGIFCERYDQERNHAHVTIHELYIQSLGDLNDKPAAIGELLLVMPQLQLFQIDQGLNASILQHSMHKLIEKEVKHTKLSTLICLNGNLHGGGKELGQLRNHFPLVHTLELTHCDLLGEDLEQMAANMPQNNNITKLRLARNIHLRGGEKAVGHLLQCTQHLEVLDMAGCELNIPDVLRSAGAQALNKLQVLDFGIYKFGNHIYTNNDELLDISRYLASMVYLKALSVAGCGCTDIHMLCQLVLNMPSSLDHLNVSVNEFGTAIAAVTQQKHISQLHRLNIGAAKYESSSWKYVCAQEDEIEAIKEAIFQLNPDMHVYHSLNECMWQLNMDKKMDG